MREWTSARRLRLGRAVLTAAAVFLLSPAIAQGATVAVFDDGTYVDTNNNSGSESDNIQASITA